MTYANGDYYEGEWAGGCRHGTGAFTYVSRGRRYDGVWDNDLPRCGSYSEVAPAPPGSRGSLPTVELARADGVLREAADAAVAAARAAELTA
jgi:hypothetical protein